MILMEITFISYINHSNEQSKNFFFKVYVFVLRESERDLCVGKEQREGEGENPKQALHCQHGARCGA